MVLRAISAQPCRCLPALGFPAHRELLQNYDAIRRETLEIALSGRLPANHEIMEQQRTLYEFDRKAWGMLPLRGYGYNYPANQNLIPTLKSFLKRHPDVVSAAISLFHRGKYCAHTKVRSKECGVFTFPYTWTCWRTTQHLVSS
jgi:aspartyl/asparaginyl beta-hydroxylase (cupin superfamily)